MKEWEVRQAGRKTKERQEARINRHNRTERERDSQVDKEICRQKKRFLKSPQETKKLDRQRDLDKNKEMYANLFLNEVNNKIYKQTKRFIER